MTCPPTIQGYLLTEVSTPPTILDCLLTSPQLQEAVGGAGVVVVCVPSVVVVVAVFDPGAGVEELTDCEVLFFSHTYEFFAVQFWFLK